MVANDQCCGRRPCRNPGAGMTLFAQMSSWWKALFDRSRIAVDVEAELQFHMEAHAQHFFDSGISPKEAFRRAKGEFGRADVQKEKYIAAIGLQPLHEIGGDIRYGLRSLYRNPSVSLVAVLSLALGIGATTAMFSLIYAALLHPFPYADASRIVNPAVIDEKRPDVPTWFVLTPSQFEAFSHAQSIDSVIGFMLAGLQTTGRELPEKVSTAFVTANESSFFGVRPLLGRDIQLSDVHQSASPNVVVLDYRFWKRHYNGDAKVIGQILQLNHQDYTVIGVMPQRFTFTQTVGIADVYTPWVPASSPVLFPWIKLKRNVDPATANAEFQSY